MNSLPQAQDILLRLETQAQQHHRTVDELLVAWLELDEQYDIERLGLLHQVVEALPASLILTDARQPDNPISYTNPECTRVTGYSASELLGNNPRLFNARDHIQPGLDTLREAIQQESACVAIVRNYRRDGSLFMNEVHLNPLQDKQGKVTHFIAVQHDVTQRELAAQEAKARKSELMVLFEQALEAIVILDDAWHIVDANPASARLFGVSKSDLLDSPLDQYLSHENQRQLKDIFQTSLSETQQPAELTILQPGGGRRIVEYRVHANYAPERHVVFMYDITDRKLTEEALQTSETRFRIITELVSDFSYSMVVQPDNQVVRDWISPGVFEQMTGFTPEESEARGGWSALIHPDDLPMNIRATQELLTETKTITLAPQRIITKSGTIRYVTAHACSQRDSAGNISRIYGAIKDITEQKLAMDALLESETRFRIISEMTSDYSFLFHVLPDGTLHRNWITPSSLEKITGFTAEELEALGGWNALIHPDDLPMLNSALNRLLTEETEIQSEYQINTKEGHVRYIAGINRSIKDATGHIAYIYGATKDITEQKLVQDALQKSEANLRAVLDNTITSYVLMDIEKRVIMANRVAQQEAQSVFGRPIRPGDSFTEFLTDFNRVEFFQKFETAVHGDVAYSQRSFETPQGVTHHFEFYYLPTIIPDGRVIGVCLATRDITERKQAEKIIRERDKLQVALEKEQELNNIKNRIMQTISHEFRTPLTVLSSSGYLLSNQFDRLSLEMRQKHLEIIKGQVLRLNEMVGEITDAIQQNFGQFIFAPKPTNLNILCELIIGDLQATVGASHDLRLYRDERLDLVSLDERLVNRILLNLLSNAIKYSPPASEITLRLSSNDREVIIEIIDRGIGIPLIDQPYLFEPFFRASNVGRIPGTGLGLNIVMDCIKLHQGSISFQSEEGKGTFITVALPLQTA